MANPPSPPLDASISTATDATRDTHGRRASDPDELLQKLERRFGHILWFLTQTRSQEDGHQYLRQLLTVDEILDTLFDNLEIHKYLLSHPVDHEALVIRQSQARKNHLIQKDIKIGGRVLRQDDFRQGDGKSEHNPKYYPKTIGPFKSIEPKAPKIAPRQDLTPEETANAFSQFVYELAYDHHPCYEGEKTTVAFHPQVAVFFGNFLFGLFSTQGLKNLQNCIRGIVQDHSDSEETMSDEEVREKANKLSETSKIDSLKQFYGTLEKCINDRSDKDPHHYLKRDMNRWNFQQHYKTLLSDYENPESPFYKQISTTETTTTTSRGRGPKTVVKKYLTQKLNCDKQMFEKIVDPARALNLVICNLGTGVIPLLSSSAASLLHNSTQTLLTCALKVYSSMPYIPKQALEIIDKKITKPLYNGNAEDIQRIKVACENHNWNSNDDFTTHISKAFGHL